MAGGEEIDVYVYFKGSGNPAENHEIIGVEIEAGGSLLKGIGDCPEPDVVETLWPKVR